MSSLGSKTSVTLIIQKMTERWLWWLWSLIVPPSRVGARGRTCWWRRWWPCSRSTSWSWCCPSSCSSSPSGYSQTCRRCLTLLYSTQRMLLLMHYLPLFTPKNVFRIIWLNKLSFPTKQSVLLANILETSCQWIRRRRRQKKQLLWLLFNMCQILLCLSMCSAVLHLLAPTLPAQF